MAPYSGFTTNPEQKGLYNEYATDAICHRSNGWHNGSRSNRLLPVPRWRSGGPGRPPRDRRRIVNGLLYLNKTGCPWALLPCCFGPWKTVYDYFRRWSQHEGLVAGVGSANPARARSGRAGRRGRRRAVLIVRRSRRQPKAKQRVMTPVKRSKAVNGICWWTPPLASTGGGYRPPMSMIERA